MKLRAEVDGLRAVCVVAVMVYHADKTLAPGGFLGVDVFFVISGFLITGILSSELNSGRFDFLIFCERRVRRIAPALLVVLAASTIVAIAWLTPPELRSFGADVASAALFMSNLKFWITDDYFAQDITFSPLIHTWSLGVEAQFYLLFPLAMLAAFRFGGRGAFTMVLTLAALSLTAAHLTAPHHQATAFYWLPFRAFELLIGAVGALICPRDGYPALPRTAREVLAACGLAAIVASMAVMDADDPLPGLWSLVPTLGALAVILCAAPGTAVGWLLSRRPVLVVGLLSYSLYLWHQPLFAFARIRFGGEVDLLWLTGLAAVALALSAVTWAFVEQPLRRRDRIAPARLWRGFALGVTMTTGIGVALFALDGAPQRLPQRALALDAAFEAGAAERHRLIGTRSCHYNRTRSGDLDRFVDAWNCADPGAVVIVAGDSHAADKAAALRLNGVPLVQVGGAGCAVAPSLMVPHCRTLFDALKARLMAQGVQLPVLLSNRFAPRELRPALIEEMLAYWAPLGGPVIVAGNMPTFWDLRNQVARRMWLEGAASASEVTLTPDLRSVGATDAPDVRAALEAAGAVLLDTRALFCALSTDCGFAAPDGAILLVDKDHLSPEGARRFGVGLRAALAPHAPGLM